MDNPNKNKVCYSTKVCGGTYWTSRSSLCRNWRIQQKEVSEDDGVFMHYRGFGFWSSCATNLERSHMDSTYEKLTFYIRKDTTDPCDKSRWNHRKNTFHYHQSTLDFIRELDLPPYSSYIT
eukprot:UN12820